METYRQKGYEESESSDKVFKGYANTGLFSSGKEALPDGVYYYIITTKTANNEKRWLNRGYLIIKR